MTLIPTEKTKRSLELWENTFVHYGPAGIGKSTFWARDEFLFIDCEGTLGGLEVYAKRVMDWEEFSFLGAEFMQGNHQFKGIVIDPIERLYKFCQNYVMKKHDIEHPSDMDWGKGWTLLSDQFVRPMMKLQLSKFCFVMISHESEYELKTRTKNFHVKKPNLPGSGPNSAYSIVRDIADYILYMTFGPDGVNRVLELSPTENWVAKKRHKEMPDEIILPPEPEKAFDHFLEIWNKALKPKGENK